MPTLHQVRRFALVNAYLVEEHDGLTLVDTAMAARRQILAAAERLGRPIVRIVLTHAHDDHVGSLDALKRTLPDAEVLISERDAPLIAGDLALRPGEPGAPGKVKGGFRGTKTRPDRLLQAGDRVGSLEVVAAPGHTPGQIALLDTRDRALLCADAFATVGRVVTTAERYWRFPLPGAATWNRELEIASAKALAALRPSLLAPGHGRVVQDPAEAIAEAIARVA